MTVTEVVYGGQKGQVESQDLGRVESEYQGIQRQIITLSVGNDTSSGVDKEVELHIWGKMNSIFIAENWKYNLEDVSRDGMICLLRRDRTIKCFGNFMETDY